VELLLAMAVAMVLVSLAVVSARSLGRGRALRGAADRLATTLRMARADAANRGKRIRLVMTVDSEVKGGQIGRLEVENAPLTEPGTFSPYKPTWAGSLEHTDVDVFACRLTGESTWSVMQVARDADEPAVAPLTFRPDGSCDSAEIHLREVGEPDGPVAIVTLDGDNARATTAILPAEHYADREEHLAP
jgi:hypothetical protein